MGILRLLLAIAVVISHIGIPRILPDGDVAVQTFFIISGFYMALILRTPGYANHLALFYTNRALKIFPAYLAVVLATLLIHFAGRYVQGVPALLGAWNDAGQLSAGAIAMIVFENLAILGQSANFFLQFDAGHALTLHNGLSTAAGPTAFVLVPQAWSMDLELMFYALAPFLVRLRTRYILGLILLSVGARILTYQYLHIDVRHAGAWTCKFFPFELSLFALGILGHRIYELLAVMNIPFKKIAGYGVLAAAVYTLFKFPRGALAIGDEYWYFYIWAGLAIPFIFLVTRNNRIDSWIGDFSYPVYVTHFLVLQLLKPWLSEGGYYAIAVGVCATLIASLLLKLALTDPIEKVRHRRKSGAASSGGSAAATMSGAASA